MIHFSVCIAIVYAKHVIRKHVMRVVNVKAEFLVNSVFDNS